MEVKEPPQGVAPPAQSVVKKATHQPSRLRKFVAQNSAGLRVRAHPSLQSEQIGVVHVNGTIAFIDEVRNTTYEQNVRSLSFIGQNLKFIYIILCIKIQG